MSYPKITNAAKDRLDKYGTHNAVQVAEILQNLSHIQVTANQTGGGTGSTVKDFVFVCPTKLKITGARFIKTVVNVGAGNLPQASLHNENDDDQIGISAAIALAGAVGDVHPLTLDDAEVECKFDDKLTFRIITPAGTITTPIQGKLQIEWHSIA